MSFGYYPSYGYGVDWTYILIIIAFIISMAVQAGMQSTFAKYSKVPSMCGMTGAEAAQRILMSEGLYSVAVQPVSGSLTDHYDPRTKTVNLSQSTYSSTSLAALGVAAHECGHAIQDAKGYAPLTVRTALVPVANFGSRFSWLLFMLGLFLSSGILLRAGILLFCAALLFQLVTLPVEFNASGRAMRKLEMSGMMASQEISGVRKVLTAAALTYVAAAASSIITLLRLLAMVNGGRRRR
jgi:Zn-dependent membrane protease YugP